MMNESTTKHVAHSHVLSRRVLVGTFAALIVLTAMTVVAGVFLDVGEWDIWLSLGIATVKMVLVCGYFMHLRYDKPLALLMLLAGGVMLVLFIGLTLLDVSSASQVQ